MPMTTSDDAQITPRQHVKPCGDCPWRRKSIRGWLGGLSSLDWIKDAHGEAEILCHTTQWQCAGAAIYRANMAKSCRDRDILALPKDKVLVFASPKEFQEYHDAKTH